MSAYDFDVVELYLPNNHMGAIEASTTLKNIGWVGGLWVRYAVVSSLQDGNSIRIKRTVEQAGPNTPVGFMLRGSYEASVKFTGRNPGETGTTTVASAGQFLFKYYETMNLAERTMPGTGSSLIYQLNESLYVSSNGLLTNENETGTARSVALCSGLPIDNNYYLGADILFP